LKVNCLLSNDKGNLWVGTDEGIAYWDGANLSNPQSAKPLHGVQVLAMAQDRDGNLWTGTDSVGLLRINETGIAQLDPAQNQTRDAVTAVFEDREGNLWVGSANGIERLRDTPFVTYSLPEGLPSDGSNPVFVDDKQRMW